MKTVLLALFSLFSLCAVADQGINSDQSYNSSEIAIDDEDEREAQENQATFEKYCQKFSEEMNKKEQSPYYLFYQKRLQHQQNTLVKKWDQFKAEWVALQKEFATEAEKILRKYRTNEAAHLREQLKTMPLLKYQDKWQADPDSFFAMMKLALGVAPANSDPEILEYQKLSVQYETLLLFSMQADYDEDEDGQAKTIALEEIDMEVLTDLFNNAFVQPFLDKATHPLLKQMNELHFGGMPPVFLAKIWLVLGDDEDDEQDVGNKQSKLDSFEKLANEFFSSEVKNCEGLLGNELGQLYTQYNDYFFTWITSMTLFEAEFFIWVALQESFMDLDAPSGSPAQ